MNFSIEKNNFVTKKPFKMKGLLFSRATVLAVVRKLR